jgi:hypothetical protein
MESPARRGEANRRIFFQTSIAKAPEECRIDTPILKMETACTSEMSATSLTTTQCYHPITQLTSIIKPS